LKSLRSPRREAHSFLKTPVGTPRGFQTHCSLQNSRSGFVGQQFPDRPAGDGRIIVAGFGTRPEPRLFVPHHFERALQNAEFTAQLPSALLDPCHVLVPASLGKRTGPNLSAPRLRAEPASPSRGVSSVSKSVSAVHFSMRSRALARSSSSPSSESI
jgi:hypothetical protein